MTEDKIALHALLEKGSDATFLREMIGFAAERLMALETESLCGAGHGERSADRRNQRNGYRDRDWETRAGTVGGRIRLFPRCGVTRTSAELHCRGSCCARPRRARRAGRVGRARRARGASGHFMNDLVGLPHPKPP